MKQGSTRTTPGRDAASASDERAGADQRAEGTRRSARLAVPKPDTSISLGSMVPGTPIKVDGFGLDTVAQGYVNACGQLGIQSAQELYVQSTGRSVHSHAGRDQIVAAGNNAYLFGRGGVLIATVDRDPTAVDAETNMPRGTGVDEARTDAGPAAESVAAFREMVESAPDARRGRDDRSNQGSYRPFAPWRQTVRDFSGFGRAAVDAVSAPARTEDTADGAAAGVTLFGQAGVLVSTPGFVGLHAGRAAVLASPAPLVLGDTPEVLGTMSATVTGVEEATLQSDVTAVVHSGQTVKVDTEPDGRIETRSGTYETEALESACVRVGDFRVLVTGKQVDIASRAGEGTSADPNKPQVVVRDKEVKLVCGRTEITVTSSSIVIKDLAGGKVTVAQGGVTACDATGQATVAVKAGEAKIGGLSVNIAAPMMKLGGQVVSLG
jgi:hypothetical protein